jgi:membrane protein implicated in regulation of membrane protease activity
MTKPRIYLACLWGASALFALYMGIARGSAVAWWFLVALVPPLIVFVWWMVDRAGLEQRIKRLEARSEIGEERRITAHSDLAEVERGYREIKTRVERMENHEFHSVRSSAFRPAKPTRAM